MPVSCGYSSSDGMAGKRSPWWRRPPAGNGAPASVEQAAGAGDCDNPCRTVPYLPKTQMEQDIPRCLAEDQDARMEADAAQWASFIADEFQIVNNTTVRNKEGARCDRQAPSGRRHRHPG